jgi:tetratricopeptide (TPR) repeat protein
MDTVWESVWECVRAGRHAIVLGAGLPPPEPADLKIVRVSCEAPGPGGGPLDAARRKVMQLLGEDVRASGPTPGQLEAGLRRRVLGDLPGPALEAQAVAAGNRLAERTGGRAALMLESLEAADPETLQSLARILRRPGWMRLPLLLTLGRVPPGPIQDFVALIRQESRDVGIFESPGSAPGAAEAGPFKETALPLDVLRVLRAASTLGATFEADLVARLLDEPPGAVLERLQQAADFGAPLADRGEGQFSLPPDVIRALQGRILPSLLAFWHARLGELLGREHGVGTAALHAPGIASSDPRPGYASLLDPGARAGAAGLPAAPEAGTRAAGIGAPGAAPRRGVEEPPPSPFPLGDPLRAATHLQAAGRTEAAVQQYLAAVRDAASRGDAGRAAGLVEQGLELLEGLPQSPRRALLRAQLLIERATLQWRGALTGAPFTLQQALLSLEAARSSLPADVPPEIVARLAAIGAGVWHDLGDPASLQRALAALAEASRQLLDAGEATLGARLLNDQAAIYIRLGDPVRATDLLERSRALFEGRLRANADDVVAREELAETHHLLARLPLHIAIAPGREADAWAMSLEHAQAAEQAYQQLGEPHELARVWETMGRLALRQGQQATAQQRLVAALTSQQQLGDVIGAARSTAALAELYRTAGRLADALTLLDSSIRFNAETGSPLGLAVNRQALGAIADTVARTPGEGAGDLRGALAEVERHLLQAESLLGRARLPGEER